VAGGGLVMAAKKKPVAKKAVKRPAAKKAGKKK
jgi:hypothetical protein